jgi:hypothetical protein
MINVRDAVEEDLEPIMGLFQAVYGESYTAARVYDRRFLLRAILDDDTAVLVAESDNKTLGTMTALLDAGDHDDLIGETCRAVVSPTAQTGGVGTALLAEVTRRLEARVHVGFGEARTVHSGAQILHERMQWIPVGFEPQKGILRGDAQRQSFVVHTKHFGDGLELRRRQPKIIAAAAPLARAALTGCRIDDVPTVVTATPIVAATDLSFSRLGDRLLVPLLRIARGRVERKEVFGRTTLAEGLFRAARDRTFYLVASRGKEPVGAAALHVREGTGEAQILELFGVDEGVMAALAAEAVRIFRTEMDAAYLEVDVSAYAPALQATFAALGMFAAAYLPAFVFEQVERLDVVRFATLAGPLDTGPRSSTRCARTLVYDALHESGGVDRGRRRRDWLRGQRDADAAATGGTEARAHLARRGCAGMRDRFAAAARQPGREDPADGADEWARGWEFSCGREPDLQHHAAGAGGR